MASTSEVYTLKRETSSRGIDFNNPNWDSAWMNLRDTMMVSMTLQGHEQSLFKRHISFKRASEVMDAPRMSKSFALHSVLERFDIGKLQKRWKSRQSLIIEGIYLLKYGDDEVTANEHEVGAPYLQGLLRLFVPRFPVLSFTELCIECRSKKKIVGGRIDIGVGTKSNGNEPSFVIEGYEPRVSLFLGCLGEAKAADVSVGHLKKTEHQVDLDDIKATIQPMLEAMAVAELTQFNDEAVPIVNIFANKSAFRPILYWRKNDVLVTTARAVPLRSQSNIDIQGLLLMFVVLQLNETTRISFKMEKIGKLAKTGWKKAMNEGDINYKDSRIKLKKYRTRLTHQDDEYPLQPQSSGEESGNSEDESDGSDQTSSKGKRVLHPSSTTKPPQEENQARLVASKVVILVV